MNTQATVVVRADCAVIVGAGLAGLATAIELAPLPCVVLNAGAVGAGTSTGWAQGGFAAALGPDDDADLHTADTLAAGAGLCDPLMVRAITGAASDAVAWLAGLGAQFDRNPDGSLPLGLEGAHSRRRIVHAHGDQTGAELLRTVVAAARTLPSVSLWDHCPARQILVEDGRVAGVLVDTPSGPVELRTGTVVLATGGIGGLFTHTTNPLTSRGQGLALAWRAGAALRDLEMVQFHPTALDVGVDPLPLVSEAVRGEGAILVNELGELVLPNPLSARDVVARAEWAQFRAGHRVFLDARAALGHRFGERFPSINQTALAAGLDPARDLVPVRPAAHYHMGGVLVDHNGQTTVPGLFAAGEVASTGLQGANRLASNSLLEAVVCGRWVAQHLREAAAEPASWTPPHVPTRADDSEQRWTPDPAIQQIRAVVTQAAGVLRDRAGLEAALDWLRGHLDDDTALVGYLVVRSALQREESRGAHTRTDFPHTSGEPRHTQLQQDSALMNDLKEDDVMSEEDLLAVSLR